MPVGRSKKKEPRVGNRDAARVPPRRATLLALKKGKMRARSLGARVVCRLCERSNDPRNKTRVTWKKLAAVKGGADRRDVIHVASKTVCNRCCATIDRANAGSATKSPAQKSTAPFAGMASDVSDNMQIWDHGHSVTPARLVRDEYGLPSKYVALDIVYAQEPEATLNGYGGTPL